eukprot:5544011-Heterocapsa_arctica.AAC.1
MLLFLFCVWLVCEVLCSVLVFLLQYLLHRRQVGRIGMLEFWQLLGKPLQQAVPAFAHGDNKWRLDCASWPGSSGRRRPAR